MAGTLVANTINTDTGLFATNNAYLGIAKAWVNFQGGGSGTSAGTINGSFNVSSITVNGTGDYTVNFTTAMANANYATLTMAQLNNAVVTNTPLAYQPYNESSISTSSRRVFCRDSGGTMTNVFQYYVGIFGA